MDPQEEEAAVATDAGAITPSQLVDYLRDAVPLALGGSEGELVATLSSAACQTKLTRYALAPTDGSSIFQG